MKAVGDKLVVVLEVECLWWPHIRLGYEVILHDSVRFSFEVAFRSEQWAIRGILVLLMILDVERESRKN